MKAKVNDANKIVKFSKYIIVGLSAVAVDFGVFIFLLDMLYFSLSIANAAGIIVGFLWSFSLNKLWAFQSSTNSFVQFFLTFFLLLFNILATTFLIAILVEQFVVPAAYAKIAMQAAVVLWNFIIYNYFIFKNEGKG